MKRIVAVAAAALVLGGIPAAASSRPVRPYLWRFRIVEIRTPGGLLCDVLVRVEDGRQEVPHFVCLRDVVQGP